MAKKAEEKRDNRKRAQRYSTAIVRKRSMLVNTQRESAERLFDTCANVIKVEGGGTSVGERSHTTSPPLALNPANSRNSEKDSVATNYEIRHPN